MDWSWLESFVLVAEAGSVRAAAEGSGLSQPTLSRHIQQLELALGLSLFDRAGRRLQLSPKGEQLLESARRVAAEVGTFQRQAAGLDEALAGTVRISATLLVGHYLLPPWVTAFRGRHPAISLELHLDDAEANLLIREAEVAVRMFRPRQEDLVARQVGQVSLGFWCSADYLERRGAPAEVGELVQHDLIGFDRLTVDLEVARAAGLDWPRDRWRVRTDQFAAQGPLAAAGAGICVVPPWVGESLGLCRVLPQVTFPGQPIFVVAHPEVRRAPRVRAAWRDLGDWLAARLAPSPADGG